MEASATNAALPLDHSRLLRSGDCNRRIGGAVVKNYLPPDMEQHNALMRRTAKIAAGCALVALFFWIIGAVSADSGNIYLPNVQRSKAEPTVAVDATPTPYVSVGSPYVPPTQTPTITPVFLVATVTPAGVTR